LRILGFKKLSIAESRVIVGFVNQGLAVTLTTST
jgi:hypothetical protein